MQRTELNLDESIRHAPAPEAGASKENVEAGYVRHIIRDAGYYKNILQRVRSKQRYKFFRGRRGNSCAYG